MLGQPIIANKKLLGALEWIVSQGGTAKIFSQDIVVGKIFGLQYRYFISEGWIGIRTSECPPGKMIGCRTLKFFIDKVCAND